VGGGDELASSQATLKALLWVPVLPAQQSKMWQNICQHS
jgi:hypothetical protein